MPFPSPLSEHVYVVPANATCNGHRAVVDAKRPRVAPCTSGTLQSFSFLQSPATTSCSLSVPSQFTADHLDLHTRNRSPSAIAKRDGLFLWRKRACFCRGGLECRRPPSHIKIIEHAATFQPPLPPKRSVASASSAFDQQAIHGCWQCGPKVKKTGHANL